MQLVLEITSGPDAGRKAWLRQGQVLEVGRTDRAGFVVSHDRGISARHFSVQCTPGGCVLRDLGSSNGTKVGGVHVTEIVLRDADTIVAGQTNFLVRLTGSDASVVLETEVFAAPSAASVVAEPAASAAQRFGRWLCRCVPPGWQTHSLGLRQLGTHTFPSTLVLLDIEAPPDITLHKFVRLQADQFAKSLSDASVEGPSAVRVDGADEAQQFTIKHPPQTEASLVQRYVFARRGTAWGAATLTTSQTQLLAKSSEFDQLLSGLRLEG